MNGLSMNPNSGGEPEPANAVKKELWSRLNQESRLPGCADKDAAMAWDPSKSLHPLTQVLFALAPPPTLVGCHDCSCQGLEEAD